MTQQEVIKAFMKSLDKTSKKGTAALDEAIKACSPFSNFQTVKNAIINDCRNAKSADDFLKTYCGIDYSTEDNGAITGSDAGGSTSKTDASIIPESGKLKTCKKSSFKVNGLTVKLGDGKTYKKLTADQKFIWNGLYTWWIKGALDLIAESYGDNFSFTNNSSATTKELYVTFYDKNDNSLSSTTASVNNGKVYRAFLHINMHYWESLKDNLTKANVDFDRNIAHELTHNVMVSNMDPYIYTSLPSFVREGIAELTEGVEKERKKDIQNLAKNSSFLSQSLVLDTNTVTISGFSDPSYAGGFIFLRYLARQAGDLTIDNETANKTVLTFYGDDSIKNTASNVLISSGASDDTISNDWNSSSKKVTIYSGTGDDVILNVSSYSTLDGGTGDDSIRNWNNSVKIYGGTGDDTLFNDSYYKKGNKVTMDGGTGDDYIVNRGNSSSVFGGTGDDTIWNYGSKVKINGGDGDDYIGGSSSYADNLSGGDGDDSIWGNGGNDKIYGGDGDDSLFGGYGNDSLWGNDGADTFFYAKGDGKDIIYGFEDDDMLQILNSKFSASYNKSKREIYFKVGSTKNAITLKNFDATTFNVNGDSYYISGKKLIKE